MTPRIDVLLAEGAVKLDRVVGFARPQIPTIPGSPLPPGVPIPPGLPPMPPTGP